MTHHADPTTIGPDDLPDGFKACVMVTLEPYVLNVVAFVDQVDDHWEVHSVRYDTYDAAINAAVEQVAEVAEREAEITARVEAAMAAYKAEITARVEATMAAYKAEITARGEAAMAAYKAEFAARVEAAMAAGATA